MFKIISGAPVRVASWDTNSTRCLPEPPVACFSAVALNIRNPFLENLESILIHETPVFPSWLAASLHQHRGSGNLAPDPEAEIQTTIAGMLQYAIGKYPPMLNRFLASYCLRGGN